MEDKAVVIVDAETTAFKRESTKQYDPSPFLSANRLVLWGCLRLNDHAVSTIWNNEKIGMSPFKMMVGHNVKFDLLWARRCPQIHMSGTSLPVWDHIVKNATVWDTQLAEYLCSGQTMTFPSLEECCVKRGIPLRKSLNLKEEIPKVDGDTSKIPDLEDYLKNDLAMTRELFLAQMADPHVQENMAWYMAQMEALLAEVEIEWNGMGLNYEKLIEKAKEGYLRTGEVDSDIKQMLLLEGYDKTFVEDYLVLTNPSHLSSLLFSGPVKWETREEIGKYKSGAKIGQPRFKVNKNEITLPKLTHVTVLTEKGELSTSDEALDAVLAAKGSLLSVAIAKGVKELRSLHKSIGTTLDGLLKWSVVENEQHVVHPQLNGCQTVTGRRSSSKPNGQNWPTDDPLKCKEVLGPVKKGRTIVSIDFKQVEVMALAYVADDPILQKDITDGVDIHTKLGNNVYGSRGITKEERRVVKTVVFGTIYGGQAETLAQQAKVPVKIVEKILAEFAKSYPRSWAYLEEVVRQAQFELDKHPITTEEIVSTPQGAMRTPMCILPSLTGRRYAFKGYWRNYRKKFTVSMTQPKNYFIQGFATGDLVPICYGRVWRWLEHHYQGVAEMIGTIHDSLVFEVDTEVVDKFIADVVPLINDAGNHLASICPAMRAWTMPVVCDIEVGINLGDLKKYEYS